MSLPRFFLDEQVLAHEMAPCFPLRLNPEDAQHARVLRISEGEHIAVIDADQDYFECKVEAVSASGLLVSITHHGDVSSDRGYVILMQGLAKGDKMDSVIRQGTELGVAEFVPLACARSVVKMDAGKAQKRTARWRSIAKHAAMQSGQPSIPEVAFPSTVEEGCALAAQATAVLVCWEEAPQTATLRNALQTALATTRTPAEEARVALVIGPEGGLEKDEVEAFLSCNPCARLVSLGPFILRTETAAVVASALVLYELRHLGGANLGC